MLWQLALAKVISPSFACPLSNALGLTATMSPYFVLKLYSHFNGLGQLAFSSKNFSQMGIEKYAWIKI